MRFAIEAAIFVTGSWQVKEFINKTTTGSMMLQIFAEVFECSEVAGRGIKSMSHTIFFALGNSTDFVFKQDIQKIVPLSIILQNPSYCREFG